ncbi:hypothetical protein BZG36_01697 [Bifiguratus adelaidae]|uniref:uracil phosphoribosyltransferase n=1 Tax=Bifiguratus adelaidae TaxID=1938954 RepID=A0A261Y4N0_9FUNG|nr:hypothetical protein BZG36_01697 [Bifiguratus adelaidae]
MHVHVSGHPVVAAKLSLLRNKDTSSKEVRGLVHELGLLLAYEATADLPLRRDKELMSPLSRYTSDVIKKRVALVPVLRSGLSLVESLLSFLPDSRVLHLGLYREKMTLEPVEYYNKLPQEPNVDVCFILDPMIATGGTAIAVVNMLKDWGIPGHSIKFIAICASREGVQHLSSMHSDIHLYTAAIDDVLDSHGYILPGLGDCGDRLYDTT